MQCLDHLRRLSWTSVNSCPASNTEQLRPCRLLRRLVALIRQSREADIDHVLGACACRSESLERPLVDDTDEGAYASGSLGLGTTRTTAEGTTTQPDSRPQPHCSTMPSPATAAPSSRASSTVLASDHPAPGTRPLPSQRIPVQSSSMVRHRLRAGKSPRCRPGCPSSTSMAIEPFTGVTRVIQCQSRRGAPCSHRPTLTPDSPPWDSWPRPLLQPP
jgi:hypothetical protein